MSRNSTPSGDPTRPPIHIVRGRRIVLDGDLAALYGVLTKRLNEVVRRNTDRFPSDFCFQLTDQEAAFLRPQFATSNSQPPVCDVVETNWSQFATSSRKHRGATYRPWAFNTVPSWPATFSTARAPCR